MIHSLRGPKQLLYYEIEFVHEMHYRKLVCSANKNVIFSYTSATGGHIKYCTIQEKTKTVSTGSCFRFKNKIIIFSQ